jgi:hypothetical protein
MSGSRSQMSTGTGLANKISLALSRIVLNNNTSLVEDEEVKDLY